MSGIFNYDGPLMRIFSRIADCAILSALWLVFCLPIVTFGAATTALYHTAYHVIRKERGSVRQTFWNAFKANWKQATIAEIILVFLCFFFEIVCYAYLLTGILSAKAMAGIYIVIVAVIAMWGIYVFSYISRFENTMIGIFITSGRMCIRHLFQSIMLLSLLIMIVLLVAVMPLFVFFLPTCCAVLHSFLLEKTFRKYMSEDDLKTELEKDNACGE